jgi:hypothetical protein
MLWMDCEYTYIIIKNHYKINDFISTRNMFVDFSSLKVIA